MTQKTQSKNEGVFTLLASIVKKSVELPADVSVLANSVTLLAEELKHIAKTVGILVSAVNKHNVAINEILDNQTIILRQMKSSSTDSKLPNLNKSKSEKPN